MAKVTEIFHRSLGVSTTSQWGLNNIIFILNQNTSTHNMLHFTAISITTWFIFTAISTTTCFTLLQDTQQPGSFYCNITTCFILLQYQSQHASFYCNMLHFTATSTTTCFILLRTSRTPPTITPSAVLCRHKSTNNLYIINLCTRFIVQA